MEDKLYIVKKVPRECKQATTKYPRIRTTAEAFNEVAKIACELNRPMSEVTSKLILFAIKHVEIIEESEEIE